MIMINSELMCHYFNSHNQILESNVDPGFFERRGSQFFFEQTQKLYFYSETTIGQHLYLEN